jgi:hypothetical protein
MVAFFMDGYCFYAYCVTAGAVAAVAATTCAQLCCNSANSNHDSFWRSRGFSGRPADVGAAHAMWSNAYNPNNPLFGFAAVLPSRYVATRYGR